MIVLIQGSTVYILFININQIYIYSSDPKILPFDHVLHSNEETISPLIILYADVFSSNFAPFHQFITELVNNGEARYILRYKPPKGKRDILYLTGYGVELALKKTDYIVIDDRKVETGMILVYANILKLRKILF